MKSISTEDRRVANIHTARFETFMSDGVEDGEVLQLNTDRPLGTGFHVYRMTPGMTTQAHSHVGVEEFLIIEGDLIDHDGTEYGPGDLVWLRDGTSHSSHSRNGCTIAVYAEEFGPPTKE